MLGALSLCVAMVVSVSADVETAPAPAPAPALSPVPATPPAPALYPLKWNPVIDLPIAGVFVAGWIGTELAKKALVAPSCHWCATNGFDTGVRRLFNPSLTPSAFGVDGPDMASNLVGFGLLPLSVAGLDLLGAWQAGEPAAFIEDLTLIVEATFGALLLNQTVKFAVARARPYTIDAPPELLASGRDPADANLSFFSGHTTLAFGLATSAGTVASLRGYRRAWLTWAVGLPIATSTALLRLAADKHWASDILVGLAIGSAVGIGVPVLFHGRTQPGGVSLHVMPAPGGVVVAGTF